MAFTPNCILNFSAVNWAFIGLTDEHQESDFRWLNNAPLYYNKWGNTEPDSQQQENCATKGGTSLHDVSCSRRDLKHLCSDIGEL